MQESLTEFLNPLEMTEEIYTFFPPMIVPEILPRITLHFFVGPHQEWFQGIHKELLL